MLYGTTETSVVMIKRVTPSGGVLGDLYQKHGDTYKSIWPIQETSPESPDFKIWEDSVKKRAEERHDKVIELDEFKGDELPPLARSYYSAELERFAMEGRIVNI